MLAAGYCCSPASGSAAARSGYMMLPGLLTGLGIGLSVVTSTIFATQGAGPAQSGLASGLVNTPRQAGGGLGLALLISLATEYTSTYRHRRAGARGAHGRLPPRLRHRCRVRHRRRCRHLHALSGGGRRSAPPPPRADGRRSARRASSRVGWLCGPARRSPRARTRPTAPIASSPRPRCTRRSCADVAHRHRVSSLPVTSSWRASTTSASANGSAKAAP